jgi:retron-type reverse transcriptase
VNFLSQEVGLPAGDIDRIIASAPRRYKEFKIKKRNGAGEREIAQPSKELKAIQRAVISRVLSSLPVHDCAHGYVAGRGIKSNAMAHISGAYVLKMDFADFFPSIKPRDLRAHIDKYLSGCFDKIEARQLEMIIFWLKKGTKSLRMCIGAPSSPFVSNSIMYEIDSRISSMCAENNVVYTRYADDLTFSSKEKGVLSRVEKGVEEILRSTKSPSIEINERKTIHVSKKQRRSITGVGLTPDGVLSIGRGKKRLIRAMAHRHSLGQLDENNQGVLIGLLGFANDVEPAFARKIWKSLEKFPPLVRANGA